MTEPNTFELYWPTELIVDTFNAASERGISFNEWIEIAVREKLARHAAFKPVPPLAATDSDSGVA